jgi:hypothetical protein
MSVEEKIRKLEELKYNDKAIFQDEYQTFLKNLKDEINEYDLRSSKILNEDINCYEDYLRVKQSADKLNETEKILGYIGKENKKIEKNIELLSEKNKKYRIKEALLELKIDDDTLTGKIEELTSNYKGKTIPILENNRLCLLFDSYLDPNTSRNILSQYSPIIFSGGDYTKIVLREV